MFKTLRQSRRYSLKRVTGSHLYFIQDKENENKTALFHHKTDFWKQIRYPKKCNNKEFDIYCETAFELQTIDLEKINLILT